MIDWMLGRSASGPGGTGDRSQIASRDAPKVRMSIP
jgi:hypothetical protein